MSKTRAEELAEKARNLAARKKAAQDEQAPLASVAAPATKAVRSTVDLSPVQHARLKSWCNEAAVEIGKSRVTTQDVLRVLVARLLADETHARLIRHDLREAKEKA